MSCNVLSNTFGTTLKINIFGASHDKEIGTVISGFPKGSEISMNKLMEFMNRRKPGRNELTTSRKEDDIPVFESGIKPLDSTGDIFITTGEDIRAVIENTNANLKDYDSLKNTPRPSHADFTARVKFGSDFDMSGGGPFSGRMTAPLCIAGGMCKQILAEKGIFTGAHIASVGKIKDKRFPLYPTKALFSELAGKELSIIDYEKESEIFNEIIRAEENGDSVGGVIECAIIGVPAGIGSPMFDGIENKLASALFGIPGVKGIDFGSGFGGSELNGSENNDPFIIRNGRIATETNNHGGSLGGISSGMPIVFRIALKPTASIAKTQRTVNTETNKETTISIKGRHDPCIAVRAVPVAEAVAAAVITDMLLTEGKF